MINEVKCGRDKRSDGSASLVEQLNEMDIYDGEEGKQRMRNDFLLMIFAGHDINAHTLTLLVYSLIKELHVHETVRQESTWFDTRRRYCDSAKLWKSKYTSAAIKEIYEYIPLSQSQCINLTKIRY
jgi:cytochrome P450